MPSKFFQHAKDKKRQHVPLGTIIDELLHSILKHVHSNKDLLSLCLVSRRLYIFSIEYLYRDITFDPAAASHRELFKRLTHGNSSVVQRIRILRLETKWTVHDEYYRKMSALILRMKNPIKFVINVPLSAPLGAAAFFLYTLHSRFPSAAIETWQNGPGLQNMRNTISTLNTHPACAQITRLNINLKSIGNLWPHCKRDLVNVIRSATNLEHLHIWTAPWISFHENLAAFQDVNFPKLKELDLGSSENPIFTCRELTQWGHQGGWGRLRILKTGSLDRLRYFVGHKVGLYALLLYTHRDSDFNDIEQIFASPNAPTPFPDFYTFYCMEMNASRRPGLCFMPVGILRWMPKVCNLALGRIQNCWNPQLEPFLPSPQHIRDIRKHCPNLKYLVIEFGLTKQWPSELIKELCQFKKPIALHLFVCFDKVRRTSTRYIGYWRIARQMYHERKRLGLPWESPFAVRFSTVYDRTCSDILNPNYAEIWFKSEKTILGDLTCPSFSLEQNLMGSARDMLDKMTLAELEAGQNRTLFGKQVKKRSRFVKEIERRKRHEEMVLGQDDYPTLYDRMVKRDG